MELTPEDYWREQVRRLEQKHSIAAEPDPYLESAVEIEAGSPNRGQIHSRVFFHDEEIFLDVFEEIEIDCRGTAHRERYAYQLMVRGIRGRRWHNDPALPDHEQYHIDDEIAGLHHVPDKWRSLMNVVEECWKEIHAVEQAMEEGQLHS